jgi:hypothetical protein
MNQSATRDGRRLSARRMLTATCAVIACVAAGAAEAAPVNLFLNASLSTGSLQGTSFSVSFSYDNSSLTGQGQEFLFLQSFDFTLLGTHFTRADIDQGGQVIFQNGTPENVTAAFFPLAPVRDIAFGFGGPGIIGYLDSNRQFGGGSYSISSFASSSSSAPEIDPSSALSTLTLLAGALAVVRGRRTGQ